MYWYISFLRPPPSFAPLSAQSIAITPQVANDLRTELRYEPTDLHHIWQRLHPSPLPPTGQDFLTTYIPPESTYRQISVPIPHDAKTGERWRLGLVASSASLDLLELSGEKPGVIGVWSEGIEFNGENIHSFGPVRGAAGQGKAKGKAKEDAVPKQSRTRREWDLPAGGLKVIEQISFDLDKKIWDSGLALSSWLWRHLSEAKLGGPSLVGRHPFVTKVLEILLGQAESAPLRVLELGSGTGFLSIALALVLRKITARAAEINVTDLDSAIDLMEENFDVNDLDVDRKAQVSVEAKVLNWDQPLPSWVGANDNWPDLIIAADVTYNTASFRSLVETLSSLLNPPRPTFPDRMLLLAYKQRDPAERDLWGMLDEKGITMRLVDEVRGSEEDGKVEIWVGGCGALGQILML